MTAHLPVFGPSATMPCDDDATPFVRVRLELVVSREQLRAALAIGHAELAGEPPLPELSVVDVRREIEGYLAACAAIEVDRESAAVNARLGEQLAGELDAALDRAYTAPAPAPVQNPEYGPGTVTLDTLDHGRITIPEPLWCTGHDGEQIVQRVDVTHVGRKVAAELETDGGTVEFLPACISWGPFAELRPEPYPLADVDEFPGMDPSQLRELAAEVGLHAGRLYRLSNELDRLRRAEA